MAKNLGIIHLNMVYELSLDEVILILLLEIERKKITLDALVETIKNKQDIRGICAYYMHTYGMWKVEKGFSENQIVMRQDVLSKLKGILP